MKNTIIKYIANRTLKYIKYLQKNNIDCLQDKEGNLIDISNVSKEKVECWLNKPIEITKNGKKGIYYKNKRYLLDKGE